MGAGLTVDRRLSAGGFERLPRGGSWSPVHGPGRWARLMGQVHGPSPWAKSVGRVRGRGPGPSTAGKFTGPVGSPGQAGDAMPRGTSHEDRRAWAVSRPGSSGTHAVGRKSGPMGRDLRWQRPQVAETSGCGGPEGPPRLEEPDSRSSLIRGGSSFLAPGPYSASDNVRSVARHYTWPPGDPGQDPAHPPRGSNKGTKTPDPAVQAP